jgi:hypothetical protein
MVSNEQVASYLTLLKIRHSAYRRNMYIEGGLFLFSLLATLAMGLLTEWYVRSFYIMAVFNVLLMVGFLQAWARLEILKGNIELIDNLKIR